MRHVGRYLAYKEIASGGMASIHLGCLPGPFDFTRRVAIKELHKHLTDDPEVVAMFVDEARLASRIVHPNVVPVLDVAREGANFFLVMDYVEGDSFSVALQATRAAGKRVPREVALAVVRDMLQGLHAAHELRDGSGELLGLIHRDVSPQNILIGTDGVTRLVDFGIAKARDRVYSTKGTDLKGKVPYMSPEQLRDTRIDRRCDLWAASVVLWEAFAGRRLFSSDIAAALIAKITDGDIPLLATIDRSLEVYQPMFDRLLAKDIAQRPATATELLDVLRAAGPPAPPNVVAAWLEDTVAERLSKRREIVRAFDAEMREYHQQSTLDRVRETQGYTPSSSAALPSSPEDGTDPDIQALPQSADAPAQESERKIWPIALALILPLFLLSAVGIALWIRKPTSFEEVPPPEVPTAPTLTTASMPPTVATTLPSAAPSVVATHPTTRTPIGIRTVTTKSAKPTRPETTASVAPVVTAAPPPNCSPPYTIGPPPDFIKTMKRECL